MGRILPPLASTEEAIIRGSFGAVEDPADAPRLRRDLHSRDPWSNSAKRERERERERERRREKQKKERRNECQQRSRASTNSPLLFFDDTTTIVRGTIPAIV